MLTHHRLIPPSCSYFIVSLPACSAAEPWTPLTKRRCAPSSRSSARSTTRRTSRTARGSWFCWAPQGPPLKVRRAGRCCDPSWASDELSELCASADRLFLPSALVLNDCGISKAGDRSNIAAFCGHVLELDLSHNQLSDWGEVGASLSGYISVFFSLLLLFEVESIFLTVSIKILSNQSMCWGPVSTTTTPS